MIESKGGIYVLVDKIAEKFFPAVEYANDATAKRGCQLLKLPVGVEEGDFELWRIGEREGFLVQAVEVYMVWKNGKMSEQEIKDAVIHGR